MYRVTLPAVVSLTLCACSLGISQPFNFGFGGSESAVPQQTASIKSSDQRRRHHPHEPAAAVGR